MGSDAGGRVVDVTADSEDEVAEVVDVIEDSEEDVAEEAPLGSPPLRFHGYRRGRELGRGASGQVFLCKRRGRRGGYAVKAVDLRKMRLSPHVEREQKKLRREVEILKSLPPHPCIVQLVDAFEEGDWFLLVLELVGGGDLYTVLTAREPPRLLEREAAFVVRQLADGLTFLHGQRIIHRDLKLENVLVASERKEGPMVLYGVKITDFGLSKAIGVGLSEALSTVGTHPYIAPEVLSTRSYDFSSDLWCLGVLLYVLLAGQFPFESISADQVGVDRVVAKLQASEMALSVLRGLLRLEPTARLRLQEMSAHTWLHDSIGARDPERPLKRQRAGAPEKAAAWPAPAPLSLGSRSTHGTESLFGSADVLVVARPAPPAPPMPPLDPGAGEGAGSVDGGGASHPSASSGASPESPRGPGAGLSADSDAVLAWGGVRPASSEPDVMQVHMVVPGGAARSALARSGARVKEIGEEAGCDVSTASPDESGAGRVVMVGGYSECAAAQELLRALLSTAAEEEHCAWLELILMVRAEAAGVVTGKQGFCLQQIRQQSGACIELLRSEVQGQRPCIVKGTVSSVLLAERHIFDLVRVVPTAPGIAPPSRASSPSGAASSTRLLLPADTATAVVGKHGFGLRQIRERCGVKVQILQTAQAPHWPHGRVLILRGPLPRRQAALGAVLELADASGGGACSLRVVVPAPEAHGVVERQAAAAAAAGGRAASLALESQEGRGECVLEVAGLREEVLAAAAAVLQALDGTRCTSSGPSEAVRPEASVT